jgi:hypothetical protein
MQSSTCCVFLQKVGSECLHKSVLHFGVFHKHKSVLHFGVFHKHKKKYFCKHNFFSKLKKYFMGYIL